MPKAIQDTSIPTRRTALAGIAAIGAGLARPALASAVTPGPDETLIRLCAGLMENQTSMAAIYATRFTFDDERRTDPELDQLHREEVAIISRIEHAGPPCSRDGARAMAQAAIALAPRDPSEEIMALPDFEWFMLTVVEFVAREDT